jgi:hypothetical protein
LSVLPKTTNALGFTAVAVHYSHDDEKNPNHPDPEIARRASEWLEAQKRAWPDPNDFQREYELSFFNAKGARVFPQFSSITHHRALEMQRSRVVYRAWDFGWWTPVCLFAQIDREGRLCILRELVGHKQTTRDFATDVIARSAEWFPLHTPGFEDYCDPAGLQVKSIDSEKNERRDIEVLNGLGIWPKYEYGWSRKDGRTLIHQLLALRADKTPSLYVDQAACKVLSEAFAGRYVFPETQNGKLREDPNDEEHPFGDVMAALRYLVTGLHRRLALTRFKAGELAARTPARTTSGYGLSRR